jgi:hypothetical protein
MVRGRVGNIGKDLTRPNENVSLEKVADQTKRAGGKRTLAPW